MRKNMQNGKKKKNPLHPSLKMKLQAQTLINSLGILESPTNFFSSPCALETNNVMSLGLLRSGTYLVKRKYQVKTKMRVMLLPSFIKTHPNSPYPPLDSTKQAESQRNSYSHVL